MWFCLKQFYLVGSQEYKSIYRLVVTLLTGTHDIESLCYFCPQSSPISTHDFIGLVQGGRFIWAKAAFEFPLPRGCVCSGGIRTRWGSRSALGLLLPESFHHTNHPGVSPHVHLFSFSCFPAGISAHNEMKLSLPMTHCSFMAVKGCFP